MKARRLLFNLIFVPIPLTVEALLGLGIFALSVQAAEATKRVEIVIKDGTAKVLSGYTIVAAPTEIVVHNEDGVTHGFNSSLFDPKDKVEMSGGYLAQGKRPHVYRVDPGKTLVLKFTAPRLEGNKTFRFWCDMHRAVEGEIFVMEWKPKSE